MRKMDYDINFLTLYEQFIIFYIYYNKKYKNQIKYFTKLSRDLGFSFTVMTKYLNLLIEKKLIFIVYKKNDKRKYIDLCDNGYNIGEKLDEINIILKRVDI